MTPPLYLGSTPVVPAGGAPSWPFWTAGDYINAPITVTASATANTKGAYTQLFASTTHASNILFLYPAVGANGVNTNTLIDIAIGAVGAEVVIASNIAVGGIGADWPIVLPVSIPLGSRVSIRTQCSTASRTSTWTAALMKGAPTAPSSLDVYGGNTSTSKGVQLAVGSGFVELIASTSKNYQMLIPVPSVPDLTNPSNPWTINIASGAAGSEVILGTISGQGSNTESVWTNRNYPPASFIQMIQGVPAGTRITASTNSSFIGVSLIGVP